MSHDVKLGELIANPNQQRDAIHIAIAPVTAAVTLFPGQRIGFIGTDRERVSTKADELIGIVDPFLRDPVYPGQRCFMFLFPNTVTGMRHHWDHPAFATQATAVDTKFAEAKAVIEAFADRVGESYEGVMEDARSFVKNGCYRCAGARWEGVWAGDEFWNAYEIVTGEKVPEDDRGGIYSCSC